MEENKLKTLKDFTLETTTFSNEMGGFIANNMISSTLLKEEAIKWVKEIISNPTSLGCSVHSCCFCAINNTDSHASFGFEEKLSNDSCGCNFSRIRFIKEFFNLTEEELEE